MLKLWMKRVNSGGPGQSDSHYVLAFPRLTPPGHSVHSLTDLLWPHWKDDDLSLDPCPGPLTLHMVTADMSYV